MPSSPDSTHQNATVAVATKTGREDEGAGERRDDQQREPRRRQDQIRVGGRDAEQRHADTTRPTRRAATSMTSSWISAPSGRTSTASSRPVRT